jgi:3-oxoacyl-(acyl-carrier-protein) synthase
MKIYVLGVGRFKGKNLDQVQLLPEFRKATHNAKLAYLSLKEALEPVSKYVEQEGFDQFSMVVGSSHGELESTKTFLDTLTQTGVARPLIFQNSLHNSTLGFLAMKFGIHGPSFTVSSHQFTGESTLELAMMLLEQELSSFCLATGVDSFLPEVKDQMAAENVLLKEGAATLLLGNEVGCRMTGALPLAQLLGVECTYESARPSDQVQQFQDYYDSNALEQIYEEVKYGAPVRELRIDKPKGGYSSIRMLSTRT